MNDHGTLLVQVFTSRAQIPIEGATVAVTQSTGTEKPRLLSLSVTDQSGKVPPILLKTPPPADSQSPNTPPGYTLCDVWAEHSEYQLLLVEGVQIFPDVETLQSMALLPLEEHANPQEEMAVVDVTPQPL